MASQSGGRADLTFGGSFAVPPAKSLPAIVDLLRFMLGRHQALRTTFRIGPDGTPRQYSVAAGDDRLRAALAESAWVPEHGRPTRNVLQVNVHDAPVTDPPDAIDLLITWDPRYLELAEIQRLATGIESVAVQAAISPEASTGIPARVSRAG